ncbi:hypothetical protein GYMLUDRAFT_606266 [Collybiopsis luxurians FD-317 M1]|uniref:Uncharacterized protein n=1 Tax=Collybiopsis luxurians FD-317 M1 TaxID=944289 RepID=A0A0D0CNP6_9AGAR|nr:hypothetical protein GYMLUDRAFT_606266 [Collybiopsis luxurians FD-317 M1]
MLLPVVCVSRRRNSRICILDFLFHFSLCPLPFALFCFVSLFSFDAGSLLLISALYSSPFCFSFLDFAERAFIFYLVIFVFPFCFHPVVRRRMRSPSPLALGFPFGYLLYHSRSMFDDQVDDIRIDVFMHLAFQVLFCNVAVLLRCFYTIRYSSFGAPLHRNRMLLLVVCVSLLFVFLISFPFSLYPLILSVFPLSSHLTLVLYFFDARPLPSFFS